MIKSTLVKCGNNYYVNIQFTSINAMHTTDIHACHIKISLVITPKCTFPDNNSELLTLQEYEGKKKLATYVSFTSTTQSSSVLAGQHKAVS